VVPRRANVALTRRLYASGRSSVSLVKKKTATESRRGMLKQVAEHLVDVHGHHDHQFPTQAVDRWTCSISSATFGRPAPRYHEV